MFIEWNKCLPYVKKCIFCQSIASAEPPFLLMSLKFTVHNLLSWFNPMVKSEHNPVREG